MGYTSLEASHIQKLEWAVSFSQVDLDNTREGDWIRLNGELYEFLYGMDLGRRLSGGRRKAKGTLKRAHNEQEDALEPNTKQEFIQSTEPRAIRAIQRAIRGDLESLASPKGQTLHLEIPEAEVWVFDPGKGNPYSPIFLVEGLPALARLNLVIHLSGSGLTREQVRTCPECGRIFLATRKPREGEESHCSIRCARTAATRRYRQKLKKKAKR